MNLYTIFRRLSIAGACLALVVIVLGAWVRLSAAGLGCPDWPGCYGHISAAAAAENLEAISARFPERPFEYAKAHKEMVHRYFASTLGFVCLLVAGIAVANRRDPRQPIVLPLVLVALVIFQGLLGMWTVTLLLKPLIVLLHLVGGLSTMAVLAWLAIKTPAETNAPRTSAPASDRTLRTVGIAAFAALVFQILLGGWTSTNYAAYSCPDFPTCQNSFWPEMDFDDAFVLWRGLGIDYEGGVLDHPARVAIHFTHRLGAILAAVLVGSWAWLAFRRGRTPTLRRAGAILGVLLVAQLILGPIMVIRALPLGLATAHNGVAALLVLAAVRLTKLQWASR
jgi:cytochrome c oxidase assembly protein subunit 15